MWSAILLILTAVLGWSVPPLGAAELGAATAAAAFERMKGLAGVWRAEGDVQKTATYEVVASGSALLERYVDESMPSGSEMVTLYHLDSGRLVLTHYCMTGNQPRMAAASFDDKKGELRFEFTGASNLKSAAEGHMHRASVRFEGPDRFTTEWEFFEDGKLAFSEEAPMRRVKP
jgi:hypothetical protein